MIFFYLATTIYAFRRPHSYNLARNAWEGLEIMKTVTAISNVVDQGSDAFYCFVKLKEKNWTEFCQCYVNPVCQSQVIKEDGIKDSEWWLKKLKYQLKEPSCVVLKASNFLSFL